MRKEARRKPWGAMPGKCKTDWIPNLPLSIVKQAECKTSTMGGGRFTATMSEHVSNGVLRRDFVPLIPPCGQKSIHTPIGRIDIKRMSGDQWRVEYDGKVFFLTSQLAPCSDVSMWQQSKIPKSSGFRITASEQTSIGPTITAETESPASEAVSKLGKEKSGGINLTAFSFFFRSSGLRRTE